MPPRKQRAIARPPPSKLKRGVCVWAPLDDYSQWPGEIVRRLDVPVEFREGFPRATADNRTVRFFAKEDRFAVVEVEGLQVYSPSPQSAHAAVLHACDIANAYILDKGAKFQREVVTRAIARRSPPAPAKPAQTGDHCVEEHFIDGTSDNDMNNVPLNGRMKKGSLMSPKTQLEAKPVESDHGVHSNKVVPEQHVTPVSPKPRASSGGSAREAGKVVASSKNSAPVPDIVTSSLTDNCKAPSSGSPPHQNALASPAGKPVAPSRTSAPRRDSLTSRADSRQVVFSKSGRPIRRPLRTRAAGTSNVMAGKATVVESPARPTAPVRPPAPPVPAAADKTAQKRRLEKEEVVPSSVDPATPQRKLSDSLMEPAKCPLVLPTNGSKRHRISTTRWRAVRGDNGEGGGEAKASVKGNDDVAEGAKSSDDERDLAAVGRLLAKMAQFTKERAAKEESLVRMRREEAELLRRITMYKARVEELEQTRRNSTAHRDELEEACGHLRADKENLGIALRHIVSEKHALEAINRGLRRENRALEEKRFDLNLTVDALKEQRNAHLEQVEKN